MATRLDVITVALQRINVTAIGESPSAEDARDTGKVLDSVFDELKATQGFTWTWDLSAVPEALLVPLGFYLATEIAQTYQRPSEPRSTALMRLRAHSLPDDREDARDYDGDGTISDDEKAAAKRAGFY
jgi:hypothetical protein